MNERFRNGDAHGKLPPIVSSVAAPPPDHLAATIRVLLIRSGQRSETSYGILKWCRESAPKRFLPEFEIDVEESDELKAAEAAFEKPEKIVVVLLGFEREELTSFISQAVKAGIELVVVSHDAHADLPANSPGHGHVAWAAASPIDSLRKALLRLYARHLVTIENLPPSSLPDYFQLRYEVWEEVWKPHEDKPRKFQNKQHWEFNYSDLTAIPFGVFSNQVGRPLVGCARLVLPKANETDYATPIRSLVEDKSALKKRLDASAYDHPYDMFEPFEGFMDYYHKFMKVKRAEVSRVIVAESWRSLCIGEALMDHVADFARSQGFQQLFLACATRHEDFYKRCGFVRIPGLTSDIFGRMKIPAIAMDCAL